MVKSPPTSALEVLLLLPSLLLQISPHGFLRLHYSFSLLIFSITHCIKHVHMHYMQGSNVATLVFVCVRVVTAGCDRAIRMHQDGLTLSPSSCIHRSPPSASSFSFSSPPFLPFISFPTLCSSFHSCFVLFFPPTYSYLLCCSISPHYSFLFLLCPCLLLTFLLCSTHPLSCYPPLFFSSALYIYPPPPTVSVHAISSFMYSSFHLTPLHHHLLLVSAPSSVETSKFWEQQQGQNLHLDISVSCSSGGGDGWRVAGAAALP